MSSIDITLIEAVKKIAPIVRAHSQEAEQERHLSPETVNAMIKAGLFRMFIPKSLGGLEVDPITCARVIEELWTVDSAAGWGLSNPVSYTHWCARLPDEGPVEMFGKNPDVIIAGPFHPPLKALPVGDGYRVTGQAPLASNCREATWIAVTAMVMDGDRPKSNEDGAPEVRMIFLRAQDCKIIDTWNALGMRGSGSDDIKVNDTYVPSTRTLLMVADFEPGSHYQGPLYRFPAMGIVCIATAPLTLAIARSAIDEVKAVAQGKTPFAATKLLREKSFAQSAIAQAEAVLRSGRRLLYATLEEAWGKALAGEKLSLEGRADLLLAATNASQSSARAVELMYSVCGATAIYKRSPLERHFRDMEVLKQHGFASQSRWETVGQVYLGLKPDFPVVAF